MRTSRLPFLSIVLMLVLCFSLATVLAPWFQNWRGNRANTGGLLGAMLGDGRRLFANHFFIKADEYFHSGYYPTIFDNREAFKTPHLAEDSGAMKGENKGDENAFLGQQNDWIDTFSRHFYPSRHTHLDQGGASGSSAPAPTKAGEGDLGANSDVGEILPWLELSAKLDPNRIQTYTATAYWLRQRMGKVAEAEQFLRDGLRANPDSYEILFELGRVYAENKNDPIRARNLWELALQKWNKSELKKEKPDDFMFCQITSSLAVLAQKQGDIPGAIGYMKLWKERAPYPSDVQKLIDDLRVSHPQKSAPAP